MRVLATGWRGALPPLRVPKTLGDFPTVFVRVQSQNSIEFEMLNTIGVEPGTEGLLKVFFAIGLGLLGQVSTYEFRIATDPRFNSCYHRSQKQPTSDDRVEVFGWTAVKHGDRNR